MTALAPHPGLGLGCDPLRDSRHRAAAAARDQADWLSWLDLGNKAARTLDTYERYTAALLRDWPDTPFAWFGDGELVHSLRKHPQRSRHIVKAAYNSWFGWGFKIAKRIPGNPVDLLPQITYKPQRAYDVFSAAEVDALCSLPTPHGELMTLLFWTGLRRQEARLLTGKRLVLDEDPRRCRVVVKEGAKGSKSRSVPMVAVASQAAARLLTLEAIDRDDHVWGSRQGSQPNRRVRTKRSDPVSDTTFNNWWGRCLEAADVRMELDSDGAFVRDRNPHLSRHTFASAMFLRGLRSRQVQQLLGHESTRTTDETYIHLSESDLAEQMFAAMGELAE